MTDLKWWACPYCKAHHFITKLQTQAEMITSHFQRRQAIHERLSATYRRIANNQREDVYDETRTDRREWQLMPLAERPLCPYFVDRCWDGE